ncbi:MAG: hypothetical protein K940chlam3_00419 [Chlamydiae bacterium]|nr:hypothetical protein [Chlamydiota bacterium]
MQNNSWTHFGIIILGLWLIASAFSFSHNSLAITVSDVVSGLLVILLTLCWMSHPCYWPRWALALVGVWLQFAPLIFWAPVAVSYLNDTLVGAAIIALAVLLTRDTLEESVPGATVPPGWSYNPSSWPQRIPIIFLGFFAWMFARYMAAYQLGYLESVYDPVFGDGTLDVITSKVSKGFPVADAGLGAMAYTIETLMAAHGGVRRWHTIPWFVVLFAILVVPLGFTSIVLIMLQPIMVGHWCFWCLLTAVSMLFMIALALDEVIAVLQYLHRARKEGRLSKVFWRGGDAEGELVDTRTASLSSLRMFPSMIWGISFPWNLWVTALLGIWLMFSPSILGEKGIVADLNHIIGALTVTFSIISMAEVARAARYLNIVFGLVALILLFFTQGAGLISQIIVGFALIGLSLPRGQIKERYGTWDRWIF